MRKEEYPDYGQIPIDQTLTACEALCWIGYKRAIPKDLYFSPYDGPDVKLSTHLNDDTSLHRAIPEPKPKDDPIGAAERLLLSALRDGSVHAFFESKNSGKLEPLPARAVQCEVTISVRGALEPDGNVAMEKFAIAHAECVYGTLYFPTAEILARWPLAPCSITPVESSETAEMNTIAAVPAPQNGAPSYGNAGIDALSPIAKPKKRHGGWNYKVSDEPLVLEAVNGVNDGSYSTSWDAAQHLSSRAVGGGTPDSKAKRILSRIKERLANPPA